jgi:hypothetical protein
MMTTKCAEMKLAADEAHLITWLRTVRELRSMPALWPCFSSSRRLFYRHYARRHYGIEKAKSRDYL